MKKKILTYTWRGKIAWETAFAAGFYFISDFKGQLKYAQIKFGGVLKYKHSPQEEQIIWISAKVKCN